MFHEFYRYCKNNHYWEPNDRILLAVSGGVDSMVLLHLFQLAAAKDNLKLAVAHIDHQIRPESVEEAKYLKKYCQEYELPFYSRKWEAANKTKNMEARARQFRYHFFDEIMTEKNYSKLVTAHHSDDQAETILMKLTRGSALTNLVGIRSAQVFGNGELLRPLLIFSKEQLTAFAEQEAIRYFEDSSNLSDEYMRNRIRHHVVPILKKENQQFLQHITDFGEQISYAEEVIQSVVIPKYQQWVTKNHNGWHIQLRGLKQEPKSVQVFFIQYLLQQTIVPEGIAISQKNIHQCLTLLNDEAPQMTMDLEQGWQIVKEYECGYLKKRTPYIGKPTFSLQLGEQLFLSEKEWLGLEKSDEPIEQPETIKNWQESSLLINSNTPLPLMIRHRQNGDRIALTPVLTKRLNRLFIDQKTPNSIREKTWVILSDDKEIIWVPDFANSHLSIPKETDKILYRLLYKIKE
jgi:tRNA(Ile)-lysidine synthetase-like protein